VAVVVVEAEEEVTTVLAVEVAHMGAVAVSVAAAAYEALLVVEL
jgi:hypothetical protein